MDTTNYSGTNMKANGLKKVNVRNMTVAAMLSAVGFVLMYVDFSVPFVPFFLKLDVSDLPALLASFSLGPVYGLLVSFVKNLLHLPVTQSGAIGELSNFILCSALVVPAGMIYQHKKTKKNAILATFVGLLVMTAVSYPSNVYIIYPLYDKFIMSEEAIMEVYKGVAATFFPFMNIDTMAKGILYFNVPFTFVKDLITALITVLIYQPLRPLLKGNN